MNPDANGLCTLFRAESGTLLAQLEQLSPDDWRRPSPCTDWDVLDVLVHMQLGCMIHARMVENALAGRMEAPWTVPDGLDARTWFQQVHRDAHVEGPAANVAHLRERFAAYDAALTLVTDASLDGPAWFYGLPATLRKVISAFVNDLIIHATDIRRPVGLEPLFSPEGGHFAGQAVVGFLPMFVSAERLAGATGTIGHTIDGETSLVELGAWGARLAADPEGSAVSPSRPVDASLTADGATWTLLAWRKRPLPEAEAQGRLRIDGDRALVEQYVSAFATP